jgi:hypothetical protein
MSTKFAPADLTAGQLEDTVKKLDSHDGVINSLQDKPRVSEPTRNWREQDGIIYTSVTSDGTTGPEWIEYFEKNDYLLNDFGKNLLCSPDFKPTKGVTTGIAILKGLLLEDRDRIISNIRDLAVQHKLATPNEEAACLIRKKFSDEDVNAMGLIWIATMHEPIKDSGGVPSLLFARRFNNGRWLYAYFSKPFKMWGREFGFSFAVPKVVNPQN